MCRPPTTNFSTISDLSPLYIAANFEVAAVDQAEQAVQYYQGPGWPYRMIGEQLGVSTAKVRAELQRRGNPVHHRQLLGPGSRTARTEVPVEKLRKLYVESAWSAKVVAAQLDSTITVVLRTGHAHGAPIRQGGGGSPAVSTAVALIDSLYRDEQISEVLDRHAVPRRPAGGDIARRFPEPVPLTAQLLDELYHGAGCSNSQIELLTGQSQVVARATMHRLGIGLRPEHMSPALLRLRGVHDDVVRAVPVDDFLEPFPGVHSVPRGPGGVVAGRLRASATGPHGRRNSASWSARPRSSGRIPGVTHHPCPATSWVCAHFLGVDARNCWAWAAAPAGDPNGPGSSVRSLLTRSWLVVVIT